MLFADTVVPDPAGHKPRFMAIIFTVSFVIFGLMGLYDTIFDEFMRPAIGEPTESGLLGNLATENQIIVNGTEMHEKIKNVDEVGMVFQHFNLFPHVTVLQNLMAGPMWVRRVKEKEARETAMKFLERVRIPEQAEKYPEQLSGGQQQRVAITRSLCMKPTEIGRAHV